MAKKLPVGYSTCDRAVAEIEENCRWPGSARYETKEESRIWLLVANFMRSRAAITHVGVSGVGTNRGRQSVLNN